MPPITTVANGRCTSEPMPVFRAIGTNPSAATSAVISTGRSRVKAPSTIASSSKRPCCLKSLMKDTNTKPLSTAIPESATNPTAADIEKGIRETSGPGRRLSTPTALPKR